MQRPLEVDDDQDRPLEDREYQDHDVIEREKTEVSLHQGKHLCTLYLIHLFI